MEKTFLLTEEQLYWLISDSEIFRKLIQTNIIDWNAVELMSRDDEVRQRMRQFPEYKEKEDYTLWEE